MRQTKYLAAAFLIATVNFLSAEEIGKIFTDPVAAGRDYQVQGEYFLDVTPKVNEKYGTQIVALGGGEFIATRMHGGFPGAGADLTKRIRILEGHTTDGITTFVERQTVVTFAKDGSITVKNSAFNIEVAKLKKQVRTSPTSGAKPPQNAVVLFNGTNGAAFNNAQVTKDGLLKTGTATKEEFDDFSLHLEFLIPFMPYARGKERGSAGVVLQNRYELLISDSFGLANPQHDSGGAIANVRPPDTNMCFPPLTWQTLDIDFVARRVDNDGKTKQPAYVTVQQNGVSIHHNVKLPPASSIGRKIGQLIESGPIQFKDAGSPVCFRNIWLVKK